MFSAKTTSRIGTWNVRTLNKPGSLEQVIREMSAYGLGLLGISEMRWKGQGMKISDGMTIYYSGLDKHVGGVGFILNAQTAQAVLSWDPVSDRIITLRLQTRIVKVTIVQVYAPTNAANDEEKDAFYDQLQQVIDSIPAHDLKLVMGDFNAQIGADNRGWEANMGKWATGEMTDNGIRLLSFCSSMELKVGGSMFQHKDIHKNTWKSPDGATTNQIDHVCISKRWATALQDVRAYRGADVGSDHMLLVAQVKLKLKRLVKKQKIEQPERSLLKDEEFRKQFQVELSNRFSALQNLEEEDLEQMWTTWKDITNDTAMKVLGPKRGSRKERWISNGTWKLIDERKVLKAKMEQGATVNTESLISYRKKDKEVKKSCRRDKQLYLENLAKEAESAATIGDSKTLYRIVKDLSGADRKSGCPIKDDNGTTLSTHEEQLKQWRHHFEAVLNCPEPAVLHDFAAETVPQLDICLEEFSAAEVQSAIRKLKNNKSAGMDNILAEYLKGGGDVMLRTLTNICNRVWKLEEVPEDWKNGIIIPLPKKGDLTRCTNWRGISLLSIPGKVMSTVLLNRIRSAIDKMLRPNQAGFRPGRSCCEQIFSLRQIVDKCLAWQRPVLMNFIDFKKAFDCIHRESLWKIVANYGIPDKVINIMKSLYRGSSCAVRVDGALSEFFEIHSGVRQGCVLSPLLFGIAMDWVLKTAMKKQAGIEWVDGKKLSDLDFADDIALLNESWDGMQTMTSALGSEAAKIGLVINVAKTKIMCIGNWTTTGKITIGTEEVEECREFCYLGSTINNDGGCDREITIRLGKANSAFGRLGRVWASKSISTKVKVRLYVSLVLAVLLYGAETWPMTKVNTRKLEAAHHRWLRKILCITWRDKVTNERIRELTQQEKLEDIIRERRLRWTGHVMRMAQDRIARESVNWVPAHGKRRPGRPHTDWQQTVKQDISRGGVSWEQVPLLAVDRVAWKELTALCASSTGGTKS